MMTMDWHKHGQKQYVRLSDAKKVIFCLSFNKDAFFLKPKAFFISRTKQIYAKTSTVFASKFKIKAMSPWTLLEILLNSAAISKQRLFTWKPVCTISSKIKTPRRYDKDIVLSFLYVKNSNNFSVTKIWSKTDDPSQ